MDTFVDSSWYFYRYLSPHRDDVPFDPAAVRHWFPIDLYVGGIEHAILHLVYSRFWTKVMRDLGLVAFDEPITRLFPQGMVHKDGEIMSKSKGNTVAPDEVIKEYGADTLRLYILSEGPPEMALEWEADRIDGSYRLDPARVAPRRSPRRCAGPGRREPDDADAVGRRPRPPPQGPPDDPKVTDDVDERIRLNTATAAFHELVNELYRLEADLQARPIGPPSARPWRPSSCS